MPKATVSRTRVESGRFEQCECCGRQLRPHEQVVQLSDGLVYVFVCLDDAAKADDELVKRTAM